MRETLYRHAREYLELGTGSLRVHARISDKNSFFLWKRLSMFDILKACLWSTGTHVVARTNHSRPWQLTSLLCHLFPLFTTEGTIQNMSLSSRQRHRRYYCCVDTLWADTLGQPEHFAFEMLCRPRQYFDRCGGLWWQVEVRHAEWRGTTTYWARIIVACDALVLLVGLSNKSLSNVDDSVQL